MQTSETRMQQMVSAVRREVDAVALRLGYDDVQPRPNPPANEEQLERYERYLGLRLPASYREFLHLHNGYEFLAYPGHMLSIESLLPGGKWHAKVLEWKKMCADYGSGEVLDGIVIANLGQPNNWAYLDPNRPTTDNELTVVVWLSADTREFPDLYEFFQGRIAVCNVDRTPHTPDDSDDDE